MKYKSIEDKLPEKRLPKKEVFKKNGKMKKQFYEKELLKLQIQLVKLQNYIKKTGKRVLIIFEGIDTCLLYTSPSPRD
jgi:polyphosphate kinase 2 (PPK2 family)